MMRWLALWMALACAGCAGGIAVPGVVAPARPPALDSAIRQSCAGPIPLPDEVDSGEVVGLMARDRAALMDCADRQQAAVKTYDSIQGGR